MSSIPDDLVLISSLPNDPDLDVLKPPSDVVEAVRATVAGSEAPEELLLWIDHQRDLQAKAEKQLSRLAAGNELEDPATRGLPAWFLEKWASVLRYPWSHKLEWAVESAKSWN